MRCCSPAAANSGRDCRTGHWSCPISQTGRSGCLLSQAGLSSRLSAPRFDSRRPTLRMQARRCSIETAMPRAVDRPRRQAVRQGGEARGGGTLRGSGAEGSCGVPFQAARAGCHRGGRTSALLYKVLQRTDNWSVRRYKVRIKGVKWRKGALFSLPGTICAKAKARCSGDTQGEFRDVYVFDGR
jgi:hypothetical protein